MATKFEKLLNSIDYLKIIQRNVNRANEAINNFKDPVEVSSPESFKEHLSIFVGYLDENVPVFEPAKFLIGDPWERSVSFFNGIYGNYGEKVAFDIAKTGNKVD